MLPEKLEAENVNFKCQVERLTKELDEKRRCIDNLQQHLTKLQTQLRANAQYYQQKLTAMTTAMELKEFTYKTLKKLPPKIFYMTGLTITEFHCLFECDCKESESTSHLRKLDKKQN